MHFLLNDSDWLVGEVCNLSTNEETDFVNSIINVEQKFLIFLLKKDKKVPNFSVI